ncbi:hypothetical protein [Pseudomonas sp.]|uniref:hypothetical protein n=1 Tax=Pseudomonas sp. TaxID=306 RepID=UPI0024883480|nr:hypothetical protein [Pseudomonas sp.]MDI1331753.1 hypothetical protein [Pseudomonas sp.]
MIVLLLFFGSAAGVWLWVVKKRGAWSLLFANLAGAFSGFIIGSLLLILYGKVFDPASVHPNAGRSLVAFLTAMGVGIGAWMLITRGTHTPLKKFLLNLFGGLAGLLGALCIAFIFSSYFAVAR